MPEFQVDFEPILKMAISVPEISFKIFFKYFKKEYESKVSAISSSEFEETNYDIKIYVDSRFIPNECIKRKIVVSRIFPLSYAWCFRNNQKTKIDLYYNTNFFRYVWRDYLAVNLHTYLLEPLLLYCGLKKGFILIHAGSAEVNGKGLVVAAESGCGKTSLILKLVQAGNKFLGDDLVWISEDGKMIRYPRSIHLFSYVLKSNSELHINKKTSISIKLKDYLRIITEGILRQRFHIATRVNIKEILKEVEIIDQSALRYFILMQKENDEAVNSDNRNKLLKKIYSINEPIQNLFDNFYWLDSFEDLRTAVLDKHNTILNKIINDSTTFIINRELLRNNIDWVINKIEYKN